VREGIKGDILTMVVGGDKLREGDENTEMLGFISFLIISFLNVEIRVLQGGDGVEIGYSVSSVDQIVRRVVIFYSRDGGEYHPIGLRINYKCENPFEGRFYWAFPYGRWGGGYLKVVAYGSEGKILEKSIVKVDESIENKTSFTKSKVVGEGNEFGDSHYKGVFSEDPYAWRMLGYDAQPISIVSTVGVKVDIYRRRGGFHDVIRLCREWDVVHAGWNIR
jgi:hypothetical protein